MNRFFNVRQIILVIKKIWKFHYKQLKGFYWTIQISMRYLKINKEFNTTHLSQLTRKKKMFSIIIKLLLSKFINVNRNRTKQKHKNYLTSILHLNGNLLFILWLVFNSHDEFGISDIILHNFLIVFGHNVGTLCIWM